MSFTEIAKPGGRSGYEEDDTFTAHPDLVARGCDEA